VGSGGGGREGAIGPARGGQGGARGRPAVRRRQPTTPVRRRRRADWLAAPHSHIPAAAATAPLPARPLGRQGWAAAASQSATLHAAATSPTPTPRPAHLVRVGPDRDAEGARQPKVGQLERVGVAVDQEVLRLEVPVQDPAGLGGSGAGGFRGVWGALGGPLQVLRAPRRL
jgi:hypothetical protein